jgi:hypothetical protein
MDIRTPDVYKMDTLIQTNHDPDEVEQAIMASLEEEWKQIENGSVQWDSFQEMLNHLKRIGNFDKNVKQVYDILSVFLYKYAFCIYESLSEDTYQFIHTHIKQIRLKKTDQETLHNILNHLRYGL